MSIIEKAMEKAGAGLPGSGTGQMPGLVGPRKKSDAECPPVAEEKITPVAPRPELIMACANTSFVGGEYRLLKERILAVRKERPDAALFMVTSPMRSEGKTLVSCNLAAALAKEFDHTALLIDADLRAPACHWMLGIPGRPRGLSDCLLHDDPVSENLIHTGIGRFSLLCAGSAIDNPAELATSRRMQEFLQEIKYRYPDRIIIIDTLPLVPFSESRALSRMVDGILLVVRENVTARAHLESALHFLEGSPVLGVVYNGVGSFGSDKEVFEFAYGYSDAP